MAASHGTLSQFDLASGDWKSYVERTKLYFIANDITDGAKKRAIFLSYRRIKDVLSPRGPAEVSFDDICTIMTTHLQPQPSEIVQRFRFNTTSRLPQESVATYVTKLKRLAETCNFGDTARLNEMMRDRLVCGVANEKWQQRLLAEDNLTYEKAFKLLLSVEASEKEVKDLSSSVNGTHATQVHQLRRHSSRQHYPSNSQEKRKPGDKPENPVKTWKPCYRCGGEHHSDKCRFKEAECRYCHKKGHIAAACRQKLKSAKPRQIHAMSDGLEEQPSEYDLPIDCLKNALSEPMTVVVNINETPVKMEVDTGATLSIMSYSTLLSTWPKDHAPELKFSEAKLRTYTGEKIAVKGALDVEVKHRNQEAQLTLTVVEGNGPTILGRDWLRHLRLDWATLNHISEVESSELKKLLKDHSVLFAEGLGKIKGTTARLYLKEGGRPRFYRARQVPYSIRDQVAKEIDRQVELGILEPVKFSPWGTPVVPIRKKDGSIRLCGDYKITINRETSTETYPLPKVEDLLASLAGGAAFSKLDLKHAYQQVVLDEETKQLVTINTHKGLYRVNRLPFGVSSAPSLFQRIMENLLQGIPGILIYIDDILVTGKTIADHLSNLEVVLTRLEEAGVRLKRDKCSFFLPSVEFLGHRISSKGIQPMLEKVEAIHKAPEPLDVTQLKSFLGAVNYYGKFLPDLSTVLAPLYKLLHRDTKWCWGPSQKKSFEHVKKLLTSDHVLVHYDSSTDLVLACDASPYGVGAVLSHRYSNGEEKPIAFASRTLCAAEKNYSQLEKEGLAIVFAVKKFHQYLYGRRFTIISDHKPLQHIFKETSAIPPLASARIQRWALLLGGYDYAITYKPGQQNANADMLSRLPTSSPSYNIPSLPETVYLMDTLDASPVTSSHVRQWTAKDPTLAKVRDSLVSGNCPREDIIKPYHRCWSELSVEQGCLLRGTRVLIPAIGRKAVMDVLHEGHPGGTRMKALARSFVWWPGIDDDLESVVKECNQCQLTRHSPAQAPLHPWEFPAAPWERLHADFAGPFLGQMFLVVVDAFSKLMEVVQLPTATSAITIERLRSIFATHGLPRVFVTDNGPQFTSSEFQVFMKNNGIKHIYSSPYHPSTNGLAERAVQSFKQHMKRLPNGSIGERLAQFLFWYRLTPHSTTGVAPAELLLGRRPRSKLDFLKPNLAETVQSKVLAQKKNHDARTRSRTFNVDEKVYVKDFPSKKWVPGKVIEIRGPLSYLIQLSDGRVRRRHVDAVRSRSVTVSLEMDNSGVEIPPVEMTEMNESDDTEPTLIVSSEMSDSNNSEPSEPDIAPPSSSPPLEQPAPPVPSSRRTSSRHRAPPMRYGFSKENTT